MLECGHGCCEKCAENLKALTKISGEERLCVACGNGGRELGRKAAEELLAMIRAAVQRNEESVEERFEVLERAVAEGAERVVAAIEAEGAACKKAIEAMREKQRLREEKRQMAYAVAEEAGPLAGRAGNAGLLLRLLRIVERMQRQQPGMKVAVDGRFVAVEEIDYRGKDVVWDEDIKTWQSRQVTAPTGFSDV